MIQCKKNGFASSIFIFLLLTTCIILPLSSNIVKAASWVVIERGPTYNIYYSASSGLYRMQSGATLINYKDSSGVYQPIDIHNLVHNPDGSWTIDTIPYRFKLEADRAHYIVFFNRTNDNTYVRFGMPQNLTNSQGEPFYKTNPTFDLPHATVTWSFTNYKMQFQFVNGYIYLKYTLMNSNARRWLNLTIQPVNMTMDDIPLISRIYDANNDERTPTITYNPVTFLYSVFVNTTGLVFPVVVDPSLTFWGDTSDGWIDYGDAVYATVHNNPTGTVYDGSSVIWIGQDSAINIYRGFAIIDTSALPDPISISVAYLNMTCNHDVSDTNFNLVVQNGQPIYPHMPLVAGDYLYSQYSGNGGTCNTSTMGDGVPFSITLNASGRSWINVTGYTKFALRSHRDILSRVPTGNEYILLESADGASYYLDITYTISISTSVNPITPYNQYEDTISLTSTGAADLSNNTLLYRYSSTNLSKSWNQTYEKYLTGQSKYQSITNPASTNQYFQTFKVAYSSENNSIVIRSIWLLMNRTGTVSTVSCAFYLCNATGVPNGASAYSTSGMVGGTKIPLGSTPGWVQFNFTGTQSKIFNAGQTYGFRMYGAVATGARANFWYDNISSTYGGGYRYQKNAIGGTFTRWKYDDYLFNISADWIRFNRSNPDTSYPWSWKFNFTYGYGYYEFQSMGAYSGSYETIIAGCDARCRFLPCPTFSYALAPVNNTAYVMKALPMVVSLNVSFVDNNGYAGFSICFYNHTSGALLQTNNSCGNGTYRYLWSVGAGYHRWNISIVGPGGSCGTNNSRIMNFSCSWYCYNLVYTLEPINNSWFNVSVLPTNISLNVTITTSDSGLFTIKWYNFSSGALLQTNASCGNGTYRYLWNVQNGTHRWYVTIVNRTECGTETSDILRFNVGISAFLFWLFNISNGAGYFFVFFCFGSLAGSVFAMVYRRRKKKQVL